MNNGLHQIKESKTPSHILTDQITEDLSVERSSLAKKPVLIRVAKFPPFCWQHRCTGGLIGSFHVNSKTRWREHIWHSHYWYVACSMYYVLFVEHVPITDFVLRRGVSVHGIFVLVIQYINCMSDEICLRAYPLWMMFFSDVCDWGVFNKFIPSVVFRIGLLSLVFVFYIHLFLNFTTIFNFIFLPLYKILAPHYVFLLYRACISISHTNDTQTRNNIFWITQRVHRAGIEPDTRCVADGCPVTSLVLWLDSCYFP